MRIVPRRPDPAHATNGSSRLGLPPGTASRIQMKYYEAGHMMYVNPPSLKKMKSDLDPFIDSTH